MAKQLYEPGQMVETSIVAITDDTIFLDLGLKSEGILARSELADENGNLSVQVGDKIKVYFLNTFIIDKNVKFHTFIIDKNVF